MNNVLNQMLNNESLEDAKKGKIVYIDVDDIHANPLNFAEMSNIDALAENISEGGLLQPLLIIKKGKQNVIHSGHRRYMAIKQLISQKKTYKYMGKEFEYEIPCIYVNEAYDSEIDEAISLMRSNSYRHYEAKERKAVVVHAHELYMQLPDYKKPKGREREWITNITGISDGLVKNILATLNKENEKDEVIKECTSELPVEDIDKEAKKIIKAMEKVIDLYANRSFCNKDLDEKVKDKLTNATSNLMEVLMKGWK